MIGILTNRRTDIRYEITTSPTSIGRHEANEIRLSGFAVSRFHAEIGRLESGKAYIEDMGSTYGTYVNGEKIEGRASLHDGDEVVMGVSTGFPDGEFAFTFKAGPGAEDSGPRMPNKPPTRHKIKEGVARLDKIDAVHIFRLNGMFRRKECDSLAEEVVRIVRGDPRHVVLDLAGVEYMNSYGMGMVVRLSQDVEAEGQRLLVAGAHGVVLKLFRTVGLDRKLRCSDTADDAARELAEEA